MSQDKNPAEPAREAYEKYAATYDKQWSRYIQDTHEATAAQLPDTEQPLTVLDIGCGTGQFLSHMQELHSNWQLHGVDISAAMLAKASDRLSASVSLLEMDGQELPYTTPASFDLIVSLSSLHYWRNPGSLLEQIHHTLRPDGAFILTDWSRDTWSMQLMDTYLTVREKAHFYTYTTAELHDLLTRHRFSITAHHTFHSTWPWHLQTVVAKKTN